MRIIIADSNELDALGLKSLCDSLDDVEHVLISHDYDSILSSGVIPDVILLDFSSSGFVLDDCRRLKRQFPNVRLVAITPLQPANTVMMAIKSGIDAYVKTDCSIKEIKESILDEGSERFFCGEILRTLKAVGVDLKKADSQDLDCDPLKLSDRELQILKYIATGHTNSEIADILYLSSHTVTTHRKNIMSKIGVKNTAEAVLYAVKEGVVDTTTMSFQKN